MLNNYKIQKIFQLSYEVFSHECSFQSDVQLKAAHAILQCKSGNLGMNFSQCDDCGYVAVHYNSCRNRCWYAFHVICIWNNYTLHIFYDTAACFYEHLLRHAP